MTKSSIMEDFLDLTLTSAHEKSPFLNYTTKLSEFENKDIVKILKLLYNNSKIDNQLAATFYNSILTQKRKYFILSYRIFNKLLSDDINTKKKSVSGTTYKRLISHLFSINAISVLKAGSSYSEHTKDEVTATIFEFKKESLLKFFNEEVDFDAQKDELLSSIYEENDENCRSKLSLKTVAQNCRSKLSLKTVAQNCRTHTNTILIHNSYSYSNTYSYSDIIYNNYYLFIKGKDDTKKIEGIIKKLLIELRQGLNNVQSLSIRSPEIVLNDLISKVELFGPIVTFEEVDSIFTQRFQKDPMFDRMWQQMKAIWEPGYDQALMRFEKEKPSICLMFSEEYELNWLNLFEKTKDFDDSFDTPETEEDGKKFEEEYFMCLNSLKFVIENTYFKCATPDHLDELRNFIIRLYSKYLLMTMSDVDLNSFMTRMSTGSDHFRKIFIDNAISDAKRTMSQVVQNVNIFDTMQDIVLPIDDKSDIIQVKGRELMGNLEFLSKTMSTQDEE